MEGGSTTYSEVGGLDTDLFIEPELIHYPTFDSADGGPENIPAWVYKPAGKGPHPVIIAIHGGSGGLPIMVYECIE